MMKKIAYEAGPQIKTYYLPEKKDIHSEKKMLPLMDHDGRIMMAN